MNKAPSVSNKWFIWGGLIPIFVGSVSLLGWVIDLPILKSVDEDLIPMAPSTAILFMPRQKNSWVVSGSGNAPSA